MDAIMRPLSYDTVISIASLVLIFVTFFIHMSEENYYNKQRYVFGGVILVGFMVSSMGLIHNLYLHILTLYSVNATFSSTFSFDTLPSAIFFSYLV